MTEKKEEEGVLDITLSTGVVLRPKPIPPAVYIRVATKAPMPRPPMTPAKNKPDILLSNPDDDNYIREVKQWDTEQHARMLFAMVSYGIEKIVSVPKGMEKHTGDRWLNKMRHTGADVFPEDDDWRMASWILEVAAETAEDFNTIFTGVGRLSGVPEEDVQKAAQFS